MEIRAATEDDIEGIRRVARDAWEAAYLDIIGEREVDAAMDEWYSREYLERTLGAEDVGYFVAHEGDEVVGYAGGGPSDEVGIGVLSSIYVAPDRWGEGIGERLLEAVERHLDGLGMARMRAAVLADNEVGNAFYRARGFERIEEREADLLAGKTVPEYVYYREIE